VQPRRDILDWAAQGRIAPGLLKGALQAGGALPQGIEWRRFLDRLLLFLGVALVAAAIVFFLAANWSALGRFARFALVEAAIAVALVFVWRLGLGRAGGKAALLAAALFVGALLALLGQSYQTGADTFELFAGWAVAILPWVLLARFPALWILWIALVNLAAILYYQTFHGFFGVLFGPERMLWVLAVINTAALAAWEVLARLGIAWLREAWAMRLLGLSSGALFTTLAVLAVSGWHEAGAWNVVAWLAWLGVAYLAYRVSQLEVFMLAWGALSVVVVVAALLASRLLSRGEAGAFLLIGVVVLGLSAAAGFWLRALAREAEQ